MCQKNIKGTNLTPLFHIRSINKQNTAETHALNYEEEFCEFPVKITFAENADGIFCASLKFKCKNQMFWTLELASYLEDAPWPATKDELIDYAIRSGAPIEVVENLQELEDEGEVYESIEDIWPDYPSQEDFLFNEDEY
jgi:hypothetical protein